MSDQSKRFYEFGAFSVDVNKRLLQCAGEPVPLAPKVLETLLVFIESRGRVLTKDELLGKIWGGTIVEEGGLARNISILRKALGERPDDHEFIITVPGRGYQWVAGVREQQERDNDSRPKATFSAYRWQILGGLVALGVGAFVYVLIQSYLRELHNDVARTAAEVRIQVPAEERSRADSSRTVKPIAHQEYLMGRYLLWKYIEDDRRRAIAHFERAIEIDPNYAPAYAGLTHAWWARGVLGPLTLKEVQLPARRAARKALELDDQLPEAYAVQAYLEGIFDWNWTVAERTIKRALDLDPNDLDAHYIYAMLLMALGRLSDAQVQIERAAQLDPLSAQVQSSFGRILYRARKFDEAILHLNKAIELEPRNTQSIRRLGDVYEQMDKYADALAQYEKARVLGANPGITKISIARVYARMGKHNEARRMLENVDNSSPAIAEVLAVLGDTDEAFRRLFQQVDERADWLPFIKTDPPFDSLHSDPRWNELLRRMNLL